MESKPLSWTGGASILSEIGTLQLEFLYLAYHTNKPNYAIKVCFFYSFLINDKHIKIFYIKRHWMCLSI